MRVYKFLNANFGISNLALKRVKVSKISELNDPFEFLAADLLDPRDLNAFAQWKSELNLNKGLISFSGSWSSPLLWGHYADSHLGMVLGFEIPDDLLAKVLYSDNRVKVQFDVTTNQIVNGASVTDKMIRTKFTDWQYEDEYRLFVDLSESKKASKPEFVDFSPSLKLEEVILGMRCDVPIDRIRDLLGNELQGTRIKKAGMARRAFKVVEDRSFR